MPQHRNSSPSPPPALIQHFVCQFLRTPPLYSRCRLQAYVHQHERNLQELMWSFSLKVIRGKREARTISKAHPVRESHARIKHQSCVLNCTKKILMPIETQPVLAVSESFCAHYILQAQ